MPQGAALREPERVAVINLTRGTILADVAEYARGPWRRCIGLLGRAALRIGEGLIFTPCTGLHTIGMRFPIDLVYIRREEPSGQTGIIVRLRANLPPCRVALTYAELAIEFPAGTIARTVTNVGDQIGLLHATRNRDGGPSMPQGTPKISGARAMPARGDKAGGGGTRAHRPPRMPDPTIGNAPSS